MLERQAPRLGVRFAAADRLLVLFAPSPGLELRAGAGDRLLAQLLVQPAIADDPHAVLNLDQDTAPL